MEKLICKIDDHEFEANDIEINVGMLNFSSGLGYQHNEPSGECAIEIRTKAELPALKTETMYNVQALHDQARCMYLIHLSKEDSGTTFMIFKTY